MKRSAIYIVGLACVFSCAARADLVIGTIDASYQGSSTDNTELRINNTSAFVFSNVVLHGTGTSGTINGVTGSKSFANVAAGTTLAYFFDTTASTGSAAVFHSDFDDTFTGAVTYTLSFTWDGLNLSASFSPSANATGGFVAFLGNNSSGNELDANISRTVVADLTAPVPEPASVELLLLSLGCVIIVLRRQKKQIEPQHRG